VFLEFFRTLMIFHGLLEFLLSKIVDADSFLNAINRKFRVATEIGSTFFGCWSVTGQLKNKI
jgi:hypothetical protein